MVEVKKLAGAIIILIFSSSFTKVSEIRVTYFLSSTCKICQYYSLTLREIHSEYSAKGVTFRALFPGKLESENTLQEYKTRYEIPFDCLMDSTEHVIMQASVTPEVFIHKNNTLVYHGRIDDSYAAIGQRRFKTKNHELRDVLNNILADKSIATTFVQPVGCIIEK